jgi:hypothetical protein
LAIDILFINWGGRLGVQWIDPDASFIHPRCNLMRLGQRLKILPVNELQDQSMRRLLCFETLLNTDQEIFGTFPGYLKLCRYDLKWFGLGHIFSRIITLGV